MIFELTNSGLKTIQTYFFDKKIFSNNLNGLL